MIALRLFAFFLLISTALPVSAQEDPLHRTEMKPSPAGSAATSPESTTPPLTGPKSSPSATTAPPLTDVLFKNLKARSIGPAVMGGRVSDIALDPHNPFIFYVGLAHGGVFKTEDPENHPELPRYVGNVETLSRELRHGESFQTADRAQ